MIKKKFEEITVVAKRKTLNKLGVTPRTQSMSSAGDNGRTPNNTYLTCACKASKKIRNL